jgi:cytochrome c-type biogenesis protein CcmH
MSFVLLLVAAAAPAVLGSPAEEARAQALEREIRCVVCQNEPISQSTAEIAGDMRELVRERIAAGDSDVEVRSFFRERYGDFVLFRPPFDARTWALWAAPALLILMGLWGVFSLTRRRAPGEAAPQPEESDR